MTTQGEQLELFPKGHPALNGTILTMEQKTLAVLEEIRELGKRQLEALDALVARRQQQDQKKK
jgi:hypothetical protein